MAALKYRDPSTGNWIELAVGASGPQGPVGATGPPGANSTVPGPQGPPGTNGTNGTNGTVGPTGPAGPTGATGAPGVGVPVGGVAGQDLVKNSATDNDTSWQYQSLPIFASVADRDAKWPSPPNGAMCITVDTGTMYQRFPGLWYTPNRTLMRVTAPTVHVFQPAPWFSPSTTLTIPAGRRIVCAAKYYITAFGSGAIGYMTLNGVIARSTLATVFDMLQFGGAGGELYGENAYVLNAGTYDFGFYIYGQTADGTGTFESFNIEGGRSENWFEIRDAGAQ